MTVVHVSLTENVFYTVEDSKLYAVDQLVANQQHVLAPAVASRVRCQTSLPPRFDMRAFLQCAYIMWTQNADAALDMAILAAHVGIEGSVTVVTIYSLSTRRVSFF